MSPAFALYAMLTLTALGIAWIQGNARQNARMAAVVNYACFACLYMLVSDLVAQDRGGYFSWYQVAPKLMGKPEDRDRLFTWALALLPRKLDEASFYFLFATTFFVFLSRSYKRFADLGMLGFRAIPFVLLVVTCDRLFMDESLNATRGSLAILLVLNGIGCTSKFTQIGFWAAGIGTHNALASITITIYLLLHPKWTKPVIPKLLFLFGVSLFLFRLITGKAVFSDLSLLNLLAAAQDSERVLRGLTSTSALTSSLATQILIAVLLPWLLARAPAAGTDDANNMQVRSTWHLALAGAAFGLILYPDFQLAQRIFLVPLLLFPMFVPVPSLRLLSLGKVALILVVLFSAFR
jgi:hypothetical protein